VHNPFGIGPIAAYILARANEVKTVRIILAAKRNGLPEEMLRERVREMYV
jgi:V/A-type H+-transporting ATPase subunit C